MKKTDKKLPEANIQVLEEHLKAAFLFLDPEEALHLEAAFLVAFLEADKDLEVAFRVEGMDPQVAFHLQEGKDPEVAFHLQEGKGLEKIRGHFKNLQEKVKQYLKSHTEYFRSKRGQNNFSEKE